ncbi:MAG: response regulator, partial [Eubacteriales bacterium]|nr:response regulator [Eubacteriales bacterium]
MSDSNTHNRNHYPLLICDDELTLRNGLKKLIERSGLPLAICGLASNGFEAFEIIREKQPSIVLMDINMPGMSGLDVIAETRKLEIPVKFIIISGHDEFQYAQRACRLEVLDYLLKPINKDELLELLERIIGKLGAVDMLASAGAVASGATVASGAVAASGAVVS